MDEIAEKLGCKTKSTTVNINNAMSIVTRAKLHIHP